MPDAYLQFKNISKVFPGVKALDEVSFSAREGRVHALIGENGAGKSTLLKILSGAHAPSGGELLLNGRAVSFPSTAEALAAGIAVIYQELYLAPEMTVAENLFLGHMPARFGILNRKRMEETARQYITVLGERFSPRARVGRLPIGQRQMVEIAKALTRGAKVIAFDEPTSSLSARETEKLFEIIRKLRDDGCVVLYVSHRLQEIFDLCDSVTVFRDGRVVETFESMEGVSHDTLVRRMVGRNITDIFNYRPRSGKRPALEVSGITGRGIGKPADFSVACGEILGVFGLVGAGRTELMRLIYGSAPRKTGTIRILERPVEIRSPEDAIRNGLMFCPEDRKKEGVIPVRSVQENINLSARRNTALLGCFIRESWERNNAAEQVRRLEIRTPSLSRQTQYLSGGNQQKVILARWLSEQIRVIILDEPTRGIDVGTKSEIYAIMQRLAEAGIGVVMVSSDLPEALGISDRVMVMREGEIAGFLNREEADEETVLRMALPAEKE